MSPRFLGPRRDIGVLTANRRHPALGALPGLLVEERQESRPPELAATFGPAETRAARLVHLRWYLVAKGEKPLDIWPRNPIYGFNQGLALVEPKLSSVAVIAAGTGGTEASGSTDELKLLSYGSPAAAERLRLRTRLSEFAEDGRPGLDRLQLRARLSPAGRGRAQWKYEFSYGPRAPEAARRGRGR
jgi:hypothetical protein